MGFYAHYHVDSMLTNQELQQIEGGKVSASYINYVIRGVNLVLDLGRSLGSAIRRIGSKKVCPL